MSVKKLSDLQKFILTRGADMPDRNDINPVHIYSSRIIHEFYGVEYKNKNFGGGHSFENVAQSIRVSVSRSLKRLESRGLITIWRGYSRWTGAELTDKGFKTVNTLSIVDTMLTG
jgi:hypothetical protein